MRMTNLIGILYTVFEIVDSGRTVPCRSEVVGLQALFEANKKEVRRNDIRLIVG